MRIFLTGNNDGPLRVAQSLRHAGLPPGGATAALQKPLTSATLREAYRAEPSLAAVEVAGDEATALGRWRDGGYGSEDLVVNCFANYRFVRFLEVAPCLNVHLAPLPRYRGRHPLHWALIDGETRFGATLHVMNAGWDDGAILWQCDVPVPPLASVAELREALMREVDRAIGTVLLVYAAAGPSVRAALQRPNPTAEATYIPRRYPSDSELTEWGDPARVVRKVMALRSEANPAYVVHEGHTVALRAAELLPAPTARPAATTTLRIERRAECLVALPPGGSSAIALYPFPEGPAA